MINMHIYIPSSNLCLSSRITICTLLYFLTCTHYFSYPRTRFQAERTRVHISPLGTCIFDPIPIVLVG